MTADTFPEAAPQEPTRALVLAAGPESGPEPGDASALLAAIDRLERLLAEESAGLRSLGVGELKELNRRKSLCLLELSRAGKPLAGAPLPTLARERLAGLRRAVERNRAALETHLAAVREVAATIAGALQAHESDGTYAQSPRIAGRVAPVGSAGR